MSRPAELFDRRTALRAAGLLAASAAAAACSSGSSPELRLAAGEVGGFFWEFSGLLADAAAAANAARIVPIITAGSVDNLDALRSGSADLAMTLADTAYESIGDDLTAIGCVYENYFQIAVRHDSPVYAASDLRGRTVSGGAVGSGAALVTERVLDAAGLSAPGTVEVIQLSMQDAARALSDNEIDAVMWAGGLPTPAFADPPIDIRLLDLSTVVADLRRKFGTAYEAVPVPVDVYGRHAAVTTVGIPNLLLARSSVPDRTAARLVDLLLDRSSALVPRQAIGSQFLDAQSLIMTGAVPLHPGAEAEYRGRHG